MRGDTTCGESQWKKLASVIRDPPTWESGDTPDVKW